MRKLAKNRRTGHSIQLLAWVVSLAPGALSQVPSDVPAELDSGDEKPADSPEAEPARLPSSQGADAIWKDLQLERGGPRLTADDAAREAASYSREARVAEADHESASAQQSRTVFNYAPRVTLTASYTRQSVPEFQSFFGGGSLVGTTAPAGPLGPGDPLFAIDGSAFNLNPIPNQWYLNAGVIIPVSDYLFNMTQSLEGVKAAKKTAKLNEKAARVSAAANARLAYYDWVRVRLMRSEAEKSHKRAEEQLKVLSEMQAAGRVARADVLRQDAFVANSELNVRRAETQESIAKKNLQVLMNGGKGEPPAWTVGEDVMKERPGDSISLAELERYHQEAMQSRLEIQALDSTAYALRKQKSVEKTRALPRVEGFGNLTYANPNPRFFPQQNEWNTSWDVGVRAVWTLNDIGAANADSRVTDAEASRVSAQREQVRDALHTEVLSAAQSMQEAAMSRESAQRGVVAAEAAYEDRKQLFENGRATAFDVLDAETTLVTARLNLVQAYVALRMARVRFEHALGRDVGSVVKAPSVPE